MKNLTADAADAIVRAAIACGRDHDFMPLTVAVLDAGGHLVRSCAKTAPASCGPILPSAKPGAPSAWGSTAG